MSEKQSVDVEESLIAEAATVCGYKRLKDEQMTAIRAFVQGRDVFMCLPTGYGKSACFLILPTVFDLMRKRFSGHSIVIVISPLTSLMKDQVRVVRKGV